jgi:hypothetical protein
MGKVSFPYLGWRAYDTEAVRRKVVLAAKKGDLVAAGRALQYVARNSNDKEVQRKARNDAFHFLLKAKDKRGKK